MASESTVHLLRWERRPRTHPHHFVVYCLVCAHMLLDDIIQLGMWTVTTVDGVLCCRRWLTVTLCEVVTNEICFFYRKMSRARCKPICEIHCRLVLFSHKSRIDADVLIPHFQRLHHTAQKRPKQLHRLFSRTHEYHSVVLSVRMSHQYLSDCEGRTPRELVVFTWCNYICQVERLLQVHLSWSCI